MGVEPSSLKHTFFAEVFCRHAFLQSATLTLIDTLVVLLCMALLMGKTSQMQGKLGARLRSAHHIE